MLVSFLNVLVCVDAILQHLVHAIDRAPQMRNRDRTANHKRNVECIQKLISIDANLHALLDVICDAVVAAQHR